MSLQGQAAQHWDNVMLGADSTHRSTCMMSGLWADRGTVGDAAGPADIRMKHNEV